VCLCVCVFMCVCVCVCVCARPRAQVRACKEDMNYQTNSFVNTQKL